MSRFISILGIGVAVAVAATFPAPPPSIASTSTCVDGQTQNLGTAVTGTTIVTGQFADGKAYVVTRALKPAVLGVYDVQAGAVTNVELPAGSGGWASTLSGNDLYIGTYEPAVIYHYDTTTGDLETVANLPDSYVWDLTTAPDGTVYAGTYPSGSVYEIDPGTQAVRNLGAAKQGEQYVRSVAADDTTIYAGVGSHAALVAIDRTTGEHRDITPPELKGEAFIYDLTAAGSHVVAGTYPGGFVASINKDDPSQSKVTKVAGANDVDQVAEAGSDVYFTARDSGTLYRFDPVTGAATALATPDPGDIPNAGLAIVGDTVYGFGFSGVLWSYNLTSGATDVHSLVAAGLRTGEPQTPQSMTAQDNERVYVGGTNSLRVHGLADQSVHDVPITGEPKAMTTVGRRLFMAMYPSGAIQSYDPATDKVATEGVIGHEQVRPLDQTYAPARKLLLTGTQPDYGKLGGALTLLGTQSGTLDVYRDVVANQSVSSIAVDRGVAYLGSDIYGGAGAQPVAKEAKLAAFDLDTRQKLWEVTPVADAQTIRHLAVLNGLVYGTTTDGTLFVFDPNRRAVLHTQQIASGEVALVAKDGYVYGASRQQLVRINPGSYDVDVVVNGLGAQGVLLAAGGGTCHLYTIAGSNLLQVSVDPPPADR